MAIMVLSTMVLLIVGVSSGLVPVMRSVEAGSSRGAAPPVIGGVESSL
jgi:hypothetical protein